MSSQQMMKHEATRLAVIANTGVGDLSIAITGTTNYPGEVTSFVLGVMPHLVERLIDEKLRGEASVQMKALFIQAYKDIVRITVESVPRPLLSKVIFKVGFNKMFSDEYDRLKPKIAGLLAAASVEGVDETVYLANMLVRQIDHSLKLGIVNDERLEATYKALDMMFDNMGTALD